jgi:plastocyanin domain-containing protein
VTEKGFEPDRVQAAAGQQVTLRFTRKVAQTCADAVEVQGDPVRHMLPLNAPVDVKVTAPKSGELAFACPMNMYRGAIVVLAQ